MIKYNDAKRYPKLVGCDGCDEAMQLCEDCHRNRVWNQGVEAERERILDDLEDMKVKDEGGSSFGRHLNEIIDVIKGVVDNSGNTA